MIILVLASLSLPLRLLVGAIFSVLEELYSSVCVFVPSASNKNVGFLYNFFFLVRLKPFELKITTCMEAQGKCTI
jgi:hypothetical protein